MVIQETRRTRRNVISPAAQIPTKSASSRALAVGAARMACALQAPLHAHSNGNTTDGDDDNEQPCESEQSKLLHDRLARFLSSPGDNEHAARGDDATSSAATRRSEVKGDLYDSVAEARAQDDDMCGPWMCASLSAGTPASASSAASASDAASIPLLAPPAHWTPRTHAFTHTHHFLREQACRRSSRTARHASD